MTLLKSWTTALHSLRYFNNKEHSIRAKWM
jgi:hypothetical protein